MRDRYIRGSPFIVTDLAAFNHHAVRVEIDEDSVCVLAGVERTTVQLHVRHCRITRMTTEARGSIRRNIHVIRRITEIGPRIDGRRQHEILVHGEETATCVAVTTVGDVPGELYMPIVVQVTTETIDGDISIVYRVNHVLEVDGLLFQTICRRVGIDVALDPCADIRRVGIVTNHAKLWIIRPVAAV